jgi:hypothetical protein
MGASIVHYRESPRHRCSHCPICFRLRVLGIVFAQLSAHACAPGGRGHGTLEVLDSGNPEPGTTPADIVWPDSWGNECDLEFFEEGNRDWHDEERSPLLDTVACCGADSCPEYGFGSIWIDPRTGLTWQVHTADLLFDQAGAESYCDALQLEGGGWRLPTITELRTLISGCVATGVGGSCNVQEDACLAVSCANESCFAGCDQFGGPDNGLYWHCGLKGSGWRYWSSSPVEDVAYAWWCISFYSGNLRYQSSFAALVRCVRN